MGKSEERDITDSMPSPLILVAIDTKLTLKKRNVQISLALYTELFFALSIFEPLHF